jgi:hypothetical protein
VVAASRWRRLIGGGRWQRLGPPGGGVGGTSGRRQCGPLSGGTGPLGGDGVEPPGGCVIVMWAAAVSRV